MLSVFLMNKDVYITLRHRDHIGWVTSKVIIQIIRPESSVFAARSFSDTVQGRHHQIVVKMAVIYTYAAALISMSCSLFVIST